ncbi:nucleotidyltransferase family protein [uncultured Erythrobacter sp.]|uniref:nucleotidyltransferase family protein n=1 Tax=uncultured Erythrobacter sp. TaxID=263913 RepID=UPI002619E9EF|nr:nucleotidyltransferase family protein [uncultured Erythrobacter sp.]
MAEPLRLAVAVLAAGSSRRFGPVDKLRAPFRGKPLGLHVSDALAEVPAELRMVIASNQQHSCAGGWRDAGFEIVRNPNADEGMGTSVATAARIARRAESDALLIALADMPLIPVSHYSAMVDAARALGPNLLIASTNGIIRMPPAIFGREQFDRLTALTGNKGARSILGEGDTIKCRTRWLADIDTPEALAALG